MPRLPPALIRQASSQNPLLALLLRVCRDLPSARNELRWLQEHARDVVKAGRYASHEDPPPPDVPGLNPAEETRSCDQRVAERDGIMQTPQDVPNWKAIGRRRMRKEATIPAQTEQSIARPPRFAKRRLWNDEGLINSEADEHAQVQKILSQNVVKRSKGMPLQYIIGNQPFGNLDILCRRRVLIPRPETEMYTEKVGNLLLPALPSICTSIGLGPRNHRTFRILDLCTGTGCIALLLHSILKPPVSGSDFKSAIPSNIDFKILGIDNNPVAVSLAQKNLAHNITQKLLHPDAANDVSFQNVDVLALAKKGADEILRILNAAAASVGEKGEDSSSPSALWDMIISNPPYIGPKDYEPGGKTELSVRNYEPKEALVPTFARGEDGHCYRSSSIVLADLFYWPLMRIAGAVGARLLVMEVGDSEQASRVCKQFFQNDSSATTPGEPTPRLETWRDDGSVRIVPARPPPPQFGADFAEATDLGISDRAVVVWTSQMADWRRGTLPASNPDLDKTFILPESHPWHEMRRPAGCRSS
ncbi:hypothetical protein AYL99_01675 [Fonsecaea erecta]|uniref:Methyltransferase small domain-containing protein n=1 Tax=Fonsecaea erecta TaxID=1367422 RepID=A0A179A2S5_9EURO|nr:hypothetical protein AYL99_01675 [Fonsecaea erecta]OAP65703.1 hypothetical protein AYL99_01675 [Fonsecaea erecta]